MAAIAQLAVEERVLIDKQRLETIVTELGETVASQVIGLALEQLALAMNRTLAAAGEGELADVVADADRLSRLAWQLGLVTLAGVAIDVGSSAEQRDLGALGATCARLHRIGSQCLTRIWDDPTQEAN
ncbi:hypothetical protein RGQ15_03640 [Paracoccus sp. MBLB3053]|uniref:Uncharacterized protein n=1 Tax=Paracoccus aurantius TaxID=3073814 RepID=A0ABU2HNR3_9RHOB|nr:hypothetical protein [Paracoccus sp. MBLB3053]MDS9466673.1 hypothetical protein [Paracoccus sp. MBLB3053]